MSAIAVTAAVLATAGAITVQLVPSSGPATPRAPATAGDPGAAGHLLTFFDAQDGCEATCTDWRRVAPRVNAVVLNSWDWPSIANIKRYNPRVKVYVYKDILSTRSDECTHGRDWGTLATGVGYCYANRYEPGWFLTDGAGHRLSMNGYPAWWVMDWGNAAYQRAWAAGVIADVKAHGWDGVWADDLNVVAHEWAPDSRYTTNAAVQSASISFVDSVGPALRAAGVPIVANVGPGGVNPVLWRALVTPLDGLESEFFLTSSTGTGGITVSRWSVDEEDLAICTGLAKACWFHTGSYSGADSGQLWDLATASLLLGNDGRQLFGFGDLRSRLGAPDLGAALSGAQRAGESAWTRHFAEGSASVDLRDMSGTVMTK